MKKLLLLCLTAAISVFVNAQPDTTIATFVNVHQGNGAGLATRTVIDTFLFPHDISGYDSIEITVLLNCPTGGCDPWDRFAEISIWHNGEWFEIGRYMTPYGVSCGWTIDVSEYRNFLKDTVIIESFIDTWTNPGWLVNIGFTFKPGTPQYADVVVENLWRDYNVVYGDSTQPVNLPERFVNFDMSTVKVVAKIVNTGHGQGNLDNAAEFSQKQHKLFAGTTQFAHLPWRSCSTNPCSPQLGNWQPARAGWCPGADVFPIEFDVTANVTPGIANSFRYELKSYYNTCSPHNPGCVTSSACPDCNYNYNGHTEPHYKLSIQAISYLSSPVGVSSPTSEHFYISPNPSLGRFTIRTNQKSEFIVEVYSLIGKREWSGKSSNGSEIDLTGLPKGIYMLSLKGNGLTGMKKIVIE